MLSTFSIDEYLKEIIDNALTALNIKDKPNIVIEKPKQKNFGDKSTNAAMLLTKILRNNPRKIAEDIIAAMEYDKSIINKIEIAGPGFINFHLSTGLLIKTAVEILKSPQSWGKQTLEKPEKAQVEFVSANPTGPLTIGHGRQAVLGDTISRMLEWIGYNVEREYYFNNAGRQMRVLGESVRLRYLELLGETIDFPEDHYQGEYIKDIARIVEKEHSNSIKDDIESEIFKNTAEQEIFEDIRGTLSRMRIEFDNFFNEKSLYENGEIESTINILKEKGLIYENEGATWFKTTELGMEQDRVIIKSSGEPTYRLPDIAYHKDKFDRKFDLIVDIFGSDHIASYPDVLAALKAMDFDSEKVKVLIHQFVTLFEGDKMVKMSTRKANFVTLDELMDEVGVDVVRYFFIMRSMDSHLNFDLSLAKKQSDENPVYYTQYAHARICSILCKAEFVKGDERFDNANWELIKHPAELELLKMILEFPKTLHHAATNFEPHKMPNYLITLSQSFHKFYTDCRVMLDDEDLRLARLALCEVSRITLQNGLEVLGISSPDKM